MSLLRAATGAVFGNVGRWILKIPGRNQSKKVGQTILYNLAGRKQTVSATLAAFRSLMVRAYGVVS